MIGTQLLNYSIVSLLGEGGMGDVYLGEHVSIKRKVAIKVLKPELVKHDTIKERFKHEASVLAQLQHPNIVGLIDYLEQDGNLFLIMEYVEGQGLDELIRSLKTPIELDRAKKLMLKILSAFAHAHKHGIVHRDVKPSNILVTKDDDIKVLDFGIAKMIGGNQMSFTRTGTQIGTVYYMSPEQVKATGIDQRSDIYSLGVTFYELLAGFCPYRSMTSEYEIFNKIIQEPLLPLNQTLGNAYDEIWEVIARATEKDPDHRIANCEEFSALIGRDVQPHHRQPPVSSAAQASKSSSIQVVIWSIVGAVAIVIIAALIISQNNPTSNGQDPELEQVAEQNSSTSDQASENSQEPVQEQIPEELDFTSEIYNFFSAERRRNLDEIIGFYSPDINRYYTNNNPSIGQIRKEYEASWRKTSYAANENPDVEKIDQYNYVVNVDYHFVMSQSGSERTIKSRLHFTFDADGRIVEVYNP